MAVIHWTTIVVLLAAGTVFSTSTELNKNSDDDPDVGNWTVGDCIMAKFSMDFTVSDTFETP